MNGFRLEGWEDLDDDEYIPVVKGINYYLQQDINDMVLEEVLEFIRDMKIELAIYYARIEALQKLEKKVKEAIRESGEIPEVEGVIVKFGKPSKRNYAHLNMLIESAAKDNMGEIIARLAELDPMIKTKKGKEILTEIRQEFAKRYIPLSRFFYEKDISPRITIET